MGGQGLGNTFDGTGRSTWRLRRALAIWSNGRTSRATTIQKANEKELDSLRSKLDDFYGPYLQLSKTNQLIATDLKSRHSSPEHMRILLLLLDPTWKQSFKSGDKAFIEDDTGSMDAATGSRPSLLPIFRHTTYIEATGYVRR